MVKKPVAATRFPKELFETYKKANYFQAHKLSAPEEWTDLVNPGYFGHFVIGAPSRSGTTHLTVEIILQTHEWDKGWTLILSSRGAREL